MQKNKKVSVKKSTKQQERRKSASTASKRSGKYCSQSNLNSEQIPSAISNSSCGNEDRTETRRGCCKKCSTQMPQSTDTISSGKEFSANIKLCSNKDTEEAVTISLSDGDSLTKLSPTAAGGCHSIGRDLLARRRQQLQCPKAKHLYHKHTVLPATFTITQEQLATEPPTSSLLPQRRESGVEMSTQPARTLHISSHPAHENTRETSVKAATVRLPKPTPSGANTARRWGGQAAMEWATAADADGSNSLPPISCSGRRKHQINHFEKKVPFYLALNLIPPQRVEAC